MPTIHVDGPELKDRAAKRRLVEACTQAAAESYGLPASTVVVLLREYSPENVGVGGALMADRFSEREQA